MLDEQPQGNPYVALAIILTATFMILLDISIVNVAIPSIQRDLHASFAQIQFVIAGYQLAYGVVLITAGRLGDIVGRKRMFMIGVAGFTVASLLCGLSQSGTQIVAARVFQGLMASLMYPQIFSIIRVTFPPRELPKALGILGAVIGVATITGPLAGGLIIQGNFFGLDWRPIFLINVPIGVFAVLAASLRLPESKSPDAPRLDLTGVAIVTVALFLLTYPLVEGRDAGWPWWSFMMLAASAVVMVFFVVFERRREAGGLDPLVVSSLFRNRAFVVGLLFFFVFFSGLPSFFLVLNLWLQIGLGFTALHSGLTIIPFAIGSGSASGLSIRLIPRFGKRILLIGAALAAIGVAVTIYSIHVIGTDLHSWQLIPADVDRRGRTRTADSAVAELRPRRHRRQGRRLRVGSPDHGATDRGSARRGRDRRDLLWPARNPCRHRQRQPDPADPPAAERREPSVRRGRPHRRQLQRLLP